MLILEDLFFVSTAWNRDLVFAGFTSPFISITSYGIKADSSYIRSFDLLSWSLGFTSWSSLQTSECKITMHNAKNMEDKMPDITNFATNTTPNAKTNEVKKEIFNISGLAFSTARNAKTSQVKTQNT